MNIVIFGPTGGTGRALTRRALDHGHAVTAVCRDPSGLGIQHPALDTVRGDVFDPDSVTSAVEGQDAVLSALGVRLGLQAVRNPPPVYSRGATHILAAMREHGVSRFIGVTSSSVDERNPEPVVWRIGKNVIGKMYDDMREMERIVRASGTDWTLVRPAMLTNGGLTQNYREHADVNHEGGWRISRVDTADFILRELEHPQHVHAAVALAY